MFRAPARSFCYEGPTRHYQEWIDAKGERFIEDIREALDALAEQIVSEGTVP